MICKSKSFFGGGNKLLVIIIKKNGKKAQMHKMRNGDGETDTKDVNGIIQDLFALFYTATQLTLQT